MASRKHKHRRQTAAGKLTHAIMYLSDLFVFLMVVAWLYVLAALTLAAAYATLRLGDTSVWSLLEQAAVLPLSVGGGIWLIRCAIQHANASRRGHKCSYDFPNIDEYGTVSDPVPDSAAPVTDAQSDKEVAD